MARGVDGRDIFIDDQDRHAFLNTLARVKLQTNTEVFAYCLMGNHFHLAVQVGTVTLGAFMQRLLTSNVLTFNARHERTGHLFQARFRDNLCLSDRYLTALIRYIHLNPVRAGLTAHPGDWPWSSYRAYQKTGRDGLIGAEEDLPNFDPWKSESTVHRPSLTRPDVDPIRPLKELCEIIAAKTGISNEALRSGSRRSDIVAAKRLLIDQALAAGHRIVHIAACLNLTPGAITNYLRIK